MNSNDAVRYVPCLRWKQGEYWAIADSSATIRTRILPLIEVAEIGFDFELRRPSKSVDDHLEKLATRVATNWGHEPCLVDLRLINASERMADGLHPMTFVFDELRSAGVRAVPVIALSQDSDCQNAVMGVIKKDARGACLRLGLAEAASPQLAASVDRKLRILDCEPHQFDLIIDEGGPNFEPLDGFVSLLQSVIVRLPYLQRWRSLTVLGTSLPESLSILGHGLSTIPRSEWISYKLLCEHLRASSIRIPWFGDYGINHPKIPAVDPRFLKTTANIRYSIPDAWLIARGQSIKKLGPGQHKMLCRRVERSGHYSGARFSPGDRYISDCAAGRASTGNPTTWRRVGTSHHLALVVQELSSFSGA